MRFLLFISVVLSMGACVSNKKITLLQKNDVNVKDLPKDSIMRTYAVDSFSYKIQPHDILSVQFESLTPKDLDFFTSNMSAMGNFTMQGNALLIGELVDEQGNIPIAVLGKIRVSGMTVFQIQDTLQLLANQYLESPKVKVRLLNYRFTILGEVMREGSVTIANSRVSWIEALGLAGGLSELADRTNIKLIRQVGDTAKVLYINLLDERFLESPYFYVHQNDVLIVPALRQRPFRRYFAQNLALGISTLSLLLYVINLSN